MLRRTGMNVLAIDTSTERVSVALMRGSERWLLEDAGGAAASATLLPAVQQLLRDAQLAPRQLDAIAFGRGPGSFTGLRTACSAAQGLAFGAGVALVPVDTLMAVAHAAYRSAGVERVTAVLDARMGEIYFAHYAWTGEGWRQEGKAGLVAPADLPLRPGWTLAGNVFRAVGESFAPGMDRVEALPDASAMLGLAPGLIARGLAVAPDEAVPMYVRDKVARTIVERAADAAALTA